MADCYYNSRGEQIELGERIGVGAEGEVFEVNGRAGLVAKVYYQSPSEEKAEKLLVLTRLQSEKLLKFAGWPVDVISQSPGGRIAGFVMKRIIQAEEVHTLHSPKSRLDKFPQASWAFLIYVAANFARAVATIHEHGFVIGDVNPKNTLVTRKATVYLLDCDSFQVRAEEKTYRCEGGFPEYTPPELHGKAFREVDREQEHDNFGLAVVIFQLLFLGRHPYSGRYMGVGEMPLEQSIKERRFAYGEDAGRREMRQPPGAPELEVVTPALIGLFRRAFLSTSAKERPTALEWVESLETLAKSLKKCAIHSGHHYYRELPACPWCEIEVRARVRLFNLANGDGSKTTFHLNEVWKEITAVLPPPGNIATVNHSPASLAPSLEYLEIERKRRRDLWASIGFSLVAGLLLGLINHPFAFFLVFVAMFIAFVVANVGFDRLNTSHLNTPLTFDNHPAIDLINEKKIQAENTASEMEEKWKNEATRERFLTKLQSLENQRDTYQNLSKIREWKLKELETAGRESQLSEFLGHFSVKDKEFKGMDPGIQTSLHIFGIKTAADITEERINLSLGMGTQYGVRLMAWRRKLERQFVFDPARAVPQQARVKIEREVDRLRLQLETELRNGALHLDRLKLEIEEKRKELLPALNDARRLLALAINDWKLVSKRNKFFPAVIVLVIAFFIGLGINGRFYIRTGFTPIEKRTQAIDNSPAKPIFVKDTVQAQNYYNLGTQQIKAKRYTEAIGFLEQAVYFDPDFADAYEALGFSHYKINDYQRSIEGWKKAIALGSNRFKTHYGLALVYLDQQNWWSAENTLKEALISRNSESEWRDDYTNAHYFLGKANFMSNGAQFEIDRLEKRLRYNDDSEDRFQLAILNLWLGNDDKVELEYNHLSRNKSKLAKELEKLRYQHKRAG